MNILFLEIDTASEWGLASVGPAALSAYLRRRGHATALLRVALDAAMDEIADEIRAASPDLLALSLTTAQWPRAKAVVREIRRKIDIPIIAGGLHPTFAPASVLAEEGFDLVCVGEGEAAMAELLQALHLGLDIAGLDIPNIRTKNGKVTRLSPPIANLDALPFMDRDLLDEQHGVLYMITQRGCPFSCAFCSAAAYREVYGEYRYFRRRSSENVIREIYHACESGPPGYVVFLDDTFTLDRRWLAEFCRRYGQEIRSGFSINGRAETVTPEMLDQLARAGCRHVIYGVESGSPSVRRDILNRPMDDAQILEAFRRTRAAGMLATANYMYGLPGETRDDVEMTLALHDKLAPDDAGFFVYYPYPGTRLAERCRSAGLLPRDYLDIQLKPWESVLSLPDLSRDDIAEFYGRFSDVCG